MPLQKNRLKQLFTEAIRPDILTDWETEELIEPLLSLPTASQSEILGQVKVIWPVSHALCGNFLNQAENGLRCLELSQLSEWVKAVLAAYEEGGLSAAQELLEKVEENFLCRLRGDSTVHLSSALRNMQPYASAIFGYPVDLACGQETYTDTTTIFLPQHVDLFSRQADNFLLYKLTISFQWAYTLLGTFNAKLAADSHFLSALRQRYHKQRQTTEPWLSGFFQLFPRPETASRLYHLAETARATSLLWLKLPGLMRECLPLCRLLASPFADDRNDPINSLQRIILNYTPEIMPAKESLPEPQLLTERFTSLFWAESATDSLSFLFDFYDSLNLDKGPSPPPLPFQGFLRLAEVDAAQRKKRKAAGEKFIKSLAPLLQPVKEKTKNKADEETAVAAAKSPENHDQANLILPGKTGKKPEAAPVSEKETTTFITIDDSQIPIPEELRKLAREIMDDQGQIPSEYISSAMQLSGKAVAKGAPPEAGGEALSGVNVYDEWDYRRKDFRKNWCSLRQKEITPTRGTFISNTLSKHKGHLLRLRRQFEMMRSQERFVRRQKDGDDIDLDALTESLADSRAGLAPSEKVFIRLARDQRSIAALFLIDMSSSTEGWVSTAIKESLVLMCEALGALGDSYGIYGFSGMRRSRSELFHIKDLNEPYNEEVKGRIAAITPQEYTRMGPPIRHLTRILSETEAKVRLLITLSDGKPEDYDDYKGDYAIEDTRHALIEAKNRGIHPFCITIDRQAHDYISHMYGEVNYIFINDVKKLPNRIPEIYRNLTT